MWIFLRTLTQITLKLLLTDNCVAASRNQKASPLMDLLSGAWLSLLLENFAKGIVWQFFLLFSRWTQRAVWSLCRVCVVVFLLLSAFSTRHLWSSSVNYKKQCLGGEGALPSPQAGCPPGMTQRTTGGVQTSPNHVTGDSHEVLN